MNKKESPLEQMAEAFKEIKEGVASICDEHSNEKKLQDFKKQMQAQPLYYCKNRMSNHSTCPNVATRRVKLCSRKEELDANHLKVEWSHRCEEHKQTGTVGKKVFESMEFDQCFALQKVNDFLNSIIGKTITGGLHKERGLIVKYKKPNGGVMCFKLRTKEWKFVYHHQIKEINS